MTPNARQIAEPSPANGENGEELPLPPVAAGPSPRVWGELSRREQPIPITARKERIRLHVRGERADPAWAIVANKVALTHRVIPQEIYFGRIFSVSYVPWLKEILKLKNKSVALCGSCCTQLKDKNVCDKMDGRDCKNVSAL